MALWSRVRVVVIVIIVAVVFIAEEPPSPQPTTPYLTPKPSDPGLPPDLRHHVTGSARGLDVEQAFRVVMEDRACPQPPCSGMDGREARTLISTLVPYQVTS